MRMLGVEVRKGKDGMMRRWVVTEIEVLKICNNVWGICLDISIRILVCCLFVRILQELLQLGMPSIVNRIYTRELYSDFLFLMY